MKKNSVPVVAATIIFAVAAAAIFLIQNSAARRAAEHAVPETEKTFDVNFRADDGRATSSRAIVQFIAENTRPRLEFHSDFSKEDFTAWQKNVKREVEKIVFPTALAAAVPVKNSDAAAHGGLTDLRAAEAAGTENSAVLANDATQTLSAEKSFFENGFFAAAEHTSKLVFEEQRDGFRIQKRECFPLPGAAVPFFVLIPDGVSEAAPAPAVLCIPGAGQPKEWLAGEGKFAAADRNDFARKFAQAGFVAVAVDNPCVGEAADTPNARVGIVDYDDTSRLLLELGWTYQGFAAFIDKTVLDELKTLPFVRRDRVAVAGFSLGTETLMLLGALDDELFAFVYNDFLCTTRERALAMTVPAADGRRRFPNSIRHLFPAFYSTFDFPDLVSALAPRPVFCNEGGLDRDFRKVRAAYALAGVPDNARCEHQPKFSAPESRNVDLERVPKGLSLAEFFRFANVDPANHYFKAESAIPWLQAQIQAADARARQ